jgi:Ser/Thr protein kinase RdoA (MazF antagonist)
MSGRAAPVADHGHRVHGMGTALEAPTWPAITAPEAAAALARFAVAGRVRGPRWHSPRPFSAATLVGTGAGEFLLKRHHRSVRTATMLADEHRFIAHLGSAGVSVPAIVPAGDGTGSVELGEWTYELHRKSPGLDLYRDRPSWTPFLTHGHAHAAGAMLARLHCAAQDYAAPARGPDPLIASMTILPAPDPLAAAIAYVAARPALAACLADTPWQAELARLFAHLGEGLAERLAAQPRLWTHNDWHPSNLLWSTDGCVATVFDFGLATRTCALHDLATAIERTAIAWLDLDAGADPDAARALLAGYRSVLPLAPDDIATLVRLLPLVHIEFALSEVDYFAGVLDDRHQALQAWHGYAVAHADWFCTGPGRHFLRLLEHAANT